MKFEYCDLDPDNLTVCWAIDGGRVFIHFTSNISELLALRKLIDEMLRCLREEEVKEDQAHKLSLRAERARGKK